MSREITQEQAQEAVNRLFDILRRLSVSGVSDLHFVGGGVASAVGHGRTVKSDDVISNEDILLWADIYDSHGGGGEYLRDDPSGVIETMAMVGSFRLRMTFRRQESGLGLTVRIVPEDPPAVDDALFNRNPIPQKLVDLTLNTPTGLILAEGPTGSGKTTLIAALIDAYNRSKNGHIFTAEDPIEFVHKPKMSVVTQLEIGHHTDSFPRALRTSLRSRPNIILVGELLDLQTVRATIEAANKGHLVFATSHASSAPEGISSLVNQFPGDEQAQIGTALSQALTAVVVQRLIPTVEGGSVPARELLLNNVAVRSKIRSGDSSSLSQVLKPKEGMWTFEDDLARLFSEGLVDEQSCLQHCNDVEAMEQKIRFVNSNLD